MPIKSLITGGVSILGVLAISSTANANCFPGQGSAGQNCNPGTVVVNPYTPEFGPVTIHNREPLGHLRSVNFQRSPNVSITRVHGLSNNVALDDAPSRFTGGCHPSSTVYCRAGSGAAAAPIAHAPVVRAPVVRAPILSVPQPRLRTWIGGGYDPAKFIPRQYGENTFTPGIAHIPTSIVDRSPERADQVLNSGRTIPQPIANGGVAPRSETYHIAQNAGPNAQFVQGPVLVGPILSGPVFANGLPALPTPAPVRAPVYQAQPTFSQQTFNQPSFAPQSFGQPTAPVHAGNGVYGSNVGADGTYWEKTSGLTQFGDTVATQVICKRQLPTQQVHPVIGVPTPVCVSPGHGAHGQHGAGFAPVQNGQHNGHGALAPSGRWTH